MEKVKNAFAEIPVALIRLYQYLARPFVGYHCRFHPTCSTYAIEAFRQYGLTRGSFLTVKRLSRCHPFTEGGHDPVPFPEKKCQIS